MVGRLHAEGGKPLCSAIFLNPWEFELVVIELLGKPWRVGGQSQEHYFGVA
jgi:hypothetical protein